MEEQKENIIEITSEHANFEVNMSQIDVNKVESLLNCICATRFKETDNHYTENNPVEQIFNDKEIKYLKEKLFEVISRY